VNPSSSFSFPRMGGMKHLHFIGIGGAGMCGIAEVLHDEGYTITGSDLSHNKATQRLQTLGIQVWIGHHADQIQGADVVVRSTAVEENNPELIAARAQMIPIIPRAAMLAELMRFRYGIAVAGTHGKTTTTSLISSILTEGGLDPSYVIGGKLNRSGHNAQLGKSSYFVAEADESDASFLFLKPMMAIVTNIDADHMSTYDNDFEKLKSTFIEFLHHLPFYGLAVLCIDDPEVRRILPLIERSKATYGFAQDASYRATNWSQQELTSVFTVIRPAPHKSLSIRLPSPGKHNVLNALASIVVATELGVNDDAICKGLANFQGVGRRFQLLGEVQFDAGRALIIDDYGHHPNEISATIEAFRQAWPNRRLLHVFQPHRYTRTQDLLQDFVKVLSLADELLLLDIYPAGEEPIPGISSQLLLDKICHNSGRAQLTSPQNLSEKLNQLVSNGCAVLMQGAGNISQLAQNLISSHAVKNS
jgi:UDP-N-acetylmuramate--alanine ligase